jgi:hypothetical protein
MGGKHLTLSPAGRGSRSRAKRGVAGRGAVTLATFVGQSTPLTPFRYSSNSTSSAMSSGGELWENSPRVCPSLSRM